VRIAELQRWVCANTGQSGWLRSDQPISTREVAVIGAGPAALSCAYYLTLAGCKVTVFAPEAQPGGALWTRSNPDPLLRTAVQNDVQGVLAGGIAYQGGLKLDEMDFRNILDTHLAIYLTAASQDDDTKIHSVWLGPGWRESLDPQTGQSTRQPKVFIGEEFLMNGISVVEAVANGRKSALALSQFLGSQA
jgi:NADPH-dependent glutamate synthase beta subunit-like oxidoreductase